jgi:uncharacterized protein (TIGR01777 family)
VRKLKSNYRVTVLGRDKTELMRVFSQPVAISTWENLDELDAKNFDVIMNLCGHNIAASRWNESVKQNIIDSRVNTCTQLINWIISNQAKPRFFCANAVGIYGLQKERDTSAFNEDTPINTGNPSDFLNEVGVRWQEALQPAIDYGLSVTTTRFGVVLKKNEGMLKKLNLSFKLGLGSVVGSGKQILSWVDITDVVNALQFLINHPELSGAFNITAPNPVSQKTFAETLARTLNRPLFLKMPDFVIRALFGEMGDCLLLRGQRVLPKRLIEAGYEFQYSFLEDALRHEYR